MAYTFIDAANGGSGSGVVTGVTPGNVSVGDCIVVGAMSGNGSGVTCVVTDSAGNTYTKYAEKAAADNGHVVMIFVGFVKLGAGAPLTVTATFSQGGAGSQIAIGRYAGIDPNSGPEGVGSATAATTTAMDAGTIAPPTAKPNDLVCAVFGFKPDIGSFTPVGGYTVRTSQLLGGNYNKILMDSDGGVVGSAPHPTGTANTNTSFTGVSIALALAAAGNPTLTAGASHSV